MSSTASSTSMPVPSVSSSSALEDSNEKEIYESCPEPSFFPHGVPLDTSSALSSRVGADVLSEGSPSSGAQPTASHVRKNGVQEAVDDTAIEPTIAYETFEGKTFKTTAFDKGFYSMDKRRREYEVMPSFSLVSKQLGNTVAAKQGVRDVMNGKTARVLMGMGSTGALETPASKMSRLQQEISEMKDFVSGLLVDSTDSEHIDTRKDKQSLLPDESPSDLLHELSSLEDQIRAVTLDPVWEHAQKSGVYMIKEPEESRAASVAGAVCDDYEEVNKQLDVVGRALHMQRLIANDSKKMDEVSRDEDKVVIEQEKQSQPRSFKMGSENVAGGVCYEFYCVPSAQQFLDRSHVGQLERRISEIESLVGVRHMSSLSYPDIPTAILQLHNRLNLVDYGHLEEMLPKLKVLHTFRSLVLCPTMTPEDECAPLNVTRSFGVHMLLPSPLL
eukprot:GHVQ01033077.1.p1 GENE.GHVQ01033077.1~~GHVQ01033077.1.p1  ORF type:complete len:444 (+),score=65.09 GHVQ01033077.1:81-1412(+)